MNITTLMQTQAISRPDAAAIIDTHQGNSRVTSFAELEQASALLAARLWHAGLRPGDVVLVFLPMSAELYSTMGAILRLGMAAMFLDPSAGRQHIEQCCQRIPPQALIAGAKAHLLRLISPALRRIPHRFVTDLPVLPGTVSLAQPASLPPHRGVVSVAADTPALFTFTSGSTGQPKAIARSHGFLLEQHRILAKSLHLQPGTVDLATLPIFVLANLASGVTSLIPDADLRRPGAIDPAPVVRQMQTHGATSATASPALLERLTDYCQTQAITLPALRRVFSGGAPVFPHLLDHLHNIAPHADIMALYGSSEAEPIAHIAHAAIRAADRQEMSSGGGLLVGPPVEDIQVRVLQDRWGFPVGPFSAAAFDALCCAPGEAGEIVVSGAHVLSGYVGGRGDAQTKFRVDGEVWHRTGDAGYLDEQGRLWLLGRCAARIDDARGRLYPFAVECAAAAHPVVRRAAVVAHQGQRVLTVERRTHADSTAALELDTLRAALAWAALDDIRCYPRLPVDRRHNAKIDYPALHAMLREG